MFGLIIAMLIVVSGCVFSAIRFNKRFEETIIIDIFSIIIVLYIFGMIGILKYGCYFLAIIAFILYAYSIYKLIKDKALFKQLFKNIVTPAFILWIIANIFIIYINFGRMFYNWDEFTHWGTAVYDMYSINALSNSSKSLISMYSYPPGLPIFEYFFEFFHFTGFREWICYFAYQLFMVSLFMRFFRNIRWNIKGIVKIILVAIVLFNVPIVFTSNYYTTIYVDAAVGLLFGFCMANITCSKKYDKEFYLNVGLGIIILTMTKDSALLFALIAVLALGLKILIAERGYEAFKHFHFKDVLKKFLPALILFLLVIIIYLSWKLSILNLHSESLNYGSGINDFTSALTGTNDSYHTAVVKNMISSSFNRPQKYGLSIIGLLLGAVLLYKILFIKQEKENKKTDNCVIAALFIGLVLYLSFLTYFYISFFSPQEAIELSSIDRYLSSFCTGVLMMITLVILDREHNNKIGTQMTIICIIIILSCNPVNNVRQLLNKNFLNQGVKYRNDWFTEYSNNVHRLIQDDNNGIYILSQNSNGLDFWVLKYSLRGTYNKISSGYYSIASSEDRKKDQYTKVLSPNEFINILIEDYDYFALYASSEEFINDYGYLFEYPEKIDSRQLYMVDKKNKKLKLVG